VTDVVCSLVYPSRAAEGRTSGNRRLDHPSQCVPPTPFHFLSEERLRRRSLQLTCKFIAHNIRRATLINLLGLAGASNATGDDQKKLDVLGNQIFIDTMKNCGKVGVIVSEEEDDVIIIKGKGARYAVVCDPIDGNRPPQL
jgi:fructose-1,6-bisphosphatase I